MFYIFGSKTTDSFAIITAFAELLPKAAALGLEVYGRLCPNGGRNMPSDAHQSAPNIRYDIIYAEKYLRYFDVYRK